MNKKIYISLACAVALNGADLGTISVESSTVNVTNIDKTTEASTINFIDSEQIAEIGAKQINEVLQTIPGVTTDVRTGEEIEIHMRGVGQQEFMGEDTGVAIIVDGVPIYAKSGKFKLNVSDIKSIKVIKGSASYLYGNTATAGAIIITTSRPKGVENEFSLGVEHGSHDYKDYNLDFLHSNENFAVNLNANDRSTDGYWVDSEYWSKSYGGKFSYYIDDMSDITVGIDKTSKFIGSSRSTITGVTAAQNDPTGSLNSPSYQKDNDVELDKYFVKYNKEFLNGGNILVNVYDYLDNYNFTSSPQDEDILGNPMASTYSNHSIEDKKQKGLKLEYTQEFEKLGFMLGYEYGDREYLESSETLIDYSALSSRPPFARQYFYEGETSKSEENQKLQAIYGEVKYAFTPKLITTFNMRHDKQTDEYKELEHDYNGVVWSDNDKNLEKTFNENSYRLGAVYNLNNNNAIFTNVSTGFRTPRVAQIQANIDDGITDEIKTQKSITYEIGNRGRIADLDYEATLFQIDTKDIIGYRDGTYSWSGPIENIGDARNRGLELSLKSDSKKTVSFNAAYTYLKSKVTKHNPFYVRGFPAFDIVGNELPRVPNHKLDLYTTYKATDNLKLISEIYAQSKYYADETNLIEMPGYAYMNLQARYTTKISSHEFELFFKINNIFDKQYYQTAYFTGDKSGDGTIDAEDPSITVNPGREYYAGIKYKF